MTSRPRRTFAGMMATVAAAAAVAAPPIHAMPLDAGPSNHPADVASPPSSIAAPAGREYQDVRMAAHRGDETPAPETATIVRSVPAPGGFDWLSAAVGAAVAASVAVLSLTAGATRRAGHRRTASA